MNMQGTHPRLRVVIAGGGIAALEALLALAQLAPELTATTVIAPNADFSYRALTVGEPFAYPPARHYPLAPIVKDAGAELLVDELVGVDTERQLALTKAGGEIAYDALLIALGAHARPLYKHALTIDDHRMDETLEGLLQDIGGGYTHSLAFVSPGRMPWQLPLYELALMTAAQAYDMDIELETTIVTPEDAPLGIFGTAASGAVAELLERARIKVITSAYAEVPRAREIVINPGDRHLQVDRIVALPELYGPELHGLPLGEHGFIRVDRFGQVLDAGPIFAAGDATEFPVKHGGLASQQADVAAQSIAALAGAPVTPEPFMPVIHGKLLTGGKPLYLTARITGGQGFSSEIAETADWSPPSKVASKYLAPYLDRRDREAAAQR